MTGSNICCQPPATCRLRRQRISTSFRCLGFYTGCKSVHTDFCHSPLEYIFAENIQVVPDQCLPNRSENTMDCKYSTPSINKGWLGQRLWTRPDASNNNSRAESVTSSNSRAKNNHSNAFPGFKFNHRGCSQRPPLFRQLLLPKG